MNGIKLICMRKKTERHRRPAVATAAIKGILLETIIFLSLVAMTARPAAAGDVLTAFVSIPPQRYFLQQIGGDRVAVQVMVEPGADAHTYEPRPRQMVALSKAVLYFAVGVQPFETVWLKKIAAANPGMKVVHTDRDIQKIPIAPHELEHREHTEAGAAVHHDHQLDPHIWLSPPLVRQQARVMLEALVAADPSHGQRYEANYRRFSARLTDLDAEFKSLFAERQGMKFMVFHPSWGYFADAYGLKQVAIEMEGKEPKPAQLSRLIDRARAENIRVIFVQPQFSAKSARLIAREIGGQVAFVDPLAEDWVANLREAADKLKAALR